VALERAKETIYIEDWWLSPELVGSTIVPLQRCADSVVSASTSVLQPRMALRSATQKKGRTGSEDLHHRLQRSKCPSSVVLAINANPSRKVSAALTCNSQHTKKVMMNLIQEGEPGYGNIKLMRHPDHNVLENAGDMTFYWVPLPP
jgi:phospholipase D1/2